MKEKQALLFLCHRKEPRDLQFFAQLKRAFASLGDAFFIFDVTQNELPESILKLPHHTFSLSGLQSLGYPWMHDQLIPGHASFPVLQFALQHPEYAHFWIVEFDVRFTGPWGAFFSLASRSPADYIGTHLTRYADQPEWYWWSSMHRPQGAIENGRLVRSFGPMYRLSREAVQVIDADLKGGCIGHFEVMLPTLTEHHGLRLLDLRKNPHFPRLLPWDLYTQGDDKPHPNLPPSTFRWRPSMPYAGWRPFTFYHPIKSTLNERDSLRRRLADALRPRKRPSP